MTDGIQIMDDTEALVLAGLTEGMPLRLIKRMLHLTDEQIAAFSQDTQDRIALLQYMTTMDRYAALSKAAKAGDSKAAVTLLERDSLSSDEFKPTPAVSININTLISEAQRLAGDVNLPPPTHDHE